MASDASLSWTNRTVLRSGCEEPYLCILDIIIFVRDLDLGLRFYVDQLGFESTSLQVPLSFLLHGYSDYFFMPKQDSHLGIGRPDGAGNFVLTTSDVDVKDTAEPIKMDIVRTGTYTIDNEGRGIISLDNGPFNLRFYAASERNSLVMRAGYDVIGESAQRSSLRFLQIEFDWLGVSPRCRRGKCTDRLKIVTMAVVRN